MSFVGYEDGYAFAREREWMVSFICHFVLEILRGAYRFRPRSFSGEDSENKSMRPRKFASFYMHEKKLTKTES